MITFTDKAGGLFIATLEWKDGVPTAAVKQVDASPASNPMSYSWSHNSEWLAYSRTDESSNQGAIWLYNVKTGAATRVTSPLFSSDSPAFDRKGDWLYFATNRNFNSPRYADLDTTFAYVNTGMLMAVPLRDNMKNPFAAKSDEEEYKKDEAKKDDTKADKKDEKKDEKKEDKKDAAPAKPDDGISGSWECSTATQQGPLVFKLNLTLVSDNKVTVTFTSPLGAGNGEGTYDKASGKFTANLQMGPTAITFEGTFKDGEAKGRA
jgi:hypothetical protein